MDFTYPAPTKMKRFLNLFLVAALATVSGASSWEPVSSVPVKTKYGKKIISATPEKPLFVSGGAKKVKVVSVAS